MSRCEMVEVRGARKYSPRVTKYVLPVQYKAVELRNTRCTSNIFRAVRLDYTR